MYEIVFNSIFHRWEVFHTIRSQIRAGERQPLFVSVLWQRCMDYTAACERRERA